MIENLPFEQDGFPTLLYAERLLARIYLHLQEPLPATIFMHSHMLMTGTENQNDKHLYACVRLGRKCSEGCDAQGTAFSDRPAPWNQTVKGEEEMDSVARHYGLATFSQV